MAQASSNQPAVRAHCLGDDLEHLTADHEYALCGRIVYWIGGIAAPTPCVECEERADG